MKYLIKYKLFESRDTKDLSIEELKSRIFRFYTPIPLTRSLSSRIIKKMFNYYNTPHFDILKGGEVKLDIGNDDQSKLKNRLRFEQYLNSLLGEKTSGEDSSTDKSSRGFDFEGLICGLFDGELSNKSTSTFDLSIKSVGNISAKFSEDKSYKLTSIKTILDLDEVKSLKSYKIIREQGLLGLIKFDINNEDHYKKLCDDYEYDTKYGVDYKKLRKDIKELLNISFSEVDYFALGYVTKDWNQIIISVINKKNMIEYILEEGLTAGKSIGSNQIKIGTSLFKKYPKYINNTITIDIPKLSREEIMEIYNGKSRDWADDIFGEDWADKMRSDVIDYMYDNREKICKSIKAYDEFNIKDQPRY